MRLPGKLHRSLLIVLLAGLSLPIIGVFHNVNGAGVWTAQALLPEVREGAAGGVVNGLIYDLKGYSLGDTGDVRIYSPITNTWSVGVPSFHPGSEFYQGATVNGHIYVIGGRPGFIIGSLVDIYSPATGTWSTGASMPIASAGHATAVVNGRIYVIGGRSGDAPFQGVVLNSLQIYDPAANSWTQGPPMPTARSDLAAAVIGNVIYVIGGWNGFTTIGTVEAFDTASNTWSARASLPTPRGDLGAAVCGSEGTIRAIGGASSFNNTTLTTNEAYNPSTNTWSTDTPMNVGRAEVTVVNLDPDTIYAIGGGFFGISSDANEVFHCPSSVKQGPGVSIAASPRSLTLMQGSSANSTITVASVNGFKGKVSLSTRIQPGATGVTTSFAPSLLDIHSGSSATSLLTFSATLGSSLGIVGVEVRAVSTSGNISAATGVILGIVPSPNSTAPDFMISSTPASVNLPTGSVGITTITLNSLNGFTGQISLTSLSNTFALATEVFPDTISLTPNGVSSVLLLMEFQFQPPGVHFNVRVDARSSSGTTVINHTITVDANFQDFILSSPLQFSTLTMRRGTSTAFPVELTSVNGFSGTVSLAANTLPRGLNLTLLPSIFVPANATAVVSLTISVASDAPGGTFTLAVFATSGPIIHAFPATIIIPDFAVTASAISVTLVIQHFIPANATISLTSLLGFVGEVDLSSMWVGTQPSGVLVSIAPQSVLLTTISSSSALLQLTPTKAASPGTFTLQVKATSGGLTHVVLITVTILKKA